MSRRFNPRRKDQAEEAAPGHAPTAVELETPEPGRDGEVNPELVRRLERLSWPAPDSAVRDRVLARILDEAAAPADTATRE